MMIRLKFDWMIWKKKEQKHLLKQELVYVFIDIYFIIIIIIIIDNNNLIK